MCGISGILGPGEKRQEVEIMLSAIYHRGPDEFGTYEDDDLSMGTARLSIIDLSNGQQPICDQRTGVTICFNGEIFNYLEIRNDLQKQGVQFLTHSDTEVILRLYLLRGENFVSQLNGQFAIAIWDPRIKKLILARDQFGICPLYYYQKGPRLFFASEIKSILTQQIVDREFNPEALDQVFTFWTPVAGHTHIRGVKELQPGHVLTAQNSEIQIQRYWSFPFSELQERSRLSLPEAVEEFSQQLQRSVEIRLRSDVEVGSYLSGGIDSSAIVAMASRFRPHGLRTYSLAFSEKTYDERPFQKIVAEKFQTQHTTVECQEQQIADSFENVIWHAESALFRTAPSPLQVLSKAVRDDGIKVVLTGEGSDEILLGYDIFREVRIRRFWSHQPNSAWRGQLFRRLYAYLPQFANPRYASLSIESFKGTLISDSPFYSHLIRWNNNSANKVYYSEDFKNSLQGRSAIETFMGTLPKEFFEVGDVSRAQYLEMQTLLRGYLLCSQGDRQMMANSVEGRFPFLDHELLQFVSQLPQKFKLNGLKDKHILRLAMKDILPDSISNRPKFAYQAPEIRAFWGLENRRSELVEHYLSPISIQQSGLFDSGKIQSLFRKIDLSGLARLGTRDNMAFVQMLSAQIFIQKFINSDIRGPAIERRKSLHFSTQIDRRKNGKR